MLYLTFQHNISHNRVHLSVSVSPSLSWSVPLFLGQSLSFWSLPNAAPARVYMCMYVCARPRVCVRARACACVCVRAHARAWGWGVEEYRIKSGSCGHASRVNRRLPSGASEEERRRKKT
jgi:hypothetical protein